MEPLDSWVMRDSSLAKLLFISGLFFVLFLVFVYFVLQSIINQNSASSSLTAFGDGEKVGVIEIKNIIFEDKKILEDMARFEKDPNIKGIIVRINSPGGVVAPSQEIHDAILRMRKAKPVVASVASMAASGAYYIAVAADTIVANPGSIIGSIGVIVRLADLSQLYSWLKIRPYNIKSGPYKDIGSDFRKMTSEEKKIMQTMVDEIHEQFVRVVAVGRGLKFDRVKKLANGRVFTGLTAKKLKLVDKVGGLHMAVDSIMELAKLDNKPKLIYPSKERKNLFRYLGSESASIYEAIFRFFQMESLPEGAPLFLAPGISP